VRGCMEFRDMTCHIRLHGKTERGGGGEKKKKNRMGHYYKKKTAKARKERRTVKRAANKSRIINEGGERERRAGS